MAREHIKIAIPVAVMDQANRIGAVIDPDTGGAETFMANASADGTSPATHCLCGVSVTEGTAQLIRSLDADQWHGALSQMATDRGRTAPSLADCQQVVAAIEVDTVSVMVLMEE
jgi:hypothetical protein